nr:uncharacterized protein LOC109157602 [Ipomoea batatas]
MADLNPKPPDLVAEITRQVLADLWDRGYRAPPTSDHRLLVEQPSFDRQQGGRQSQHSQQNLTATQTPTDDLPSIQPGQISSTLLQTQSVMVASDGSQPAMATAVATIPSPFVFTAMSDPVSRMAGGASALGDINKWPGIFPGLFGCGTGGGDHVLNFEGPKLLGQNSSFGNLQQKVAFSTQWYYPKVPVAKKGFNFQPSSQPANRSNAQFQVEDSSTRVMLVLRSYFYGTADTSWEKGDWSNREFVGGQGSPPKTSKVPFGAGSLDLGKDPSREPPGGFLYGLSYAHFSEKGFPSGVPGVWGIEEKVQVLEEVVQQNLDDEGHSLTIRNLGPFCRGRVSIEEEYWQKRAHMVLSGG